VDFTMEIGRKEAGNYLFLYNPLTTEVHVQNYEKEIEVEIYKYKHFLGTLEIDKQGKIVIVEDFGLELNKIDEFQIEIK
jgi:hypothetical protein